MRDIISSSTVWFMFVVAVLRIVLVSSITWFVGQWIWYVVHIVWEIVPVE